ncbi:MAG: hypothetical protein IJE96_06805 [Mailhella sp.]|nr:hypothetical protein [Mailhella sp.]
MKSVKTLPEFAAISELEINAALDAYDDAMEEEHSSCGGCEASEENPTNPVVAEVFRLITAYTDRMNELVVLEKEQNKEISESFLADLLSFEAEAPIERIAFDFVADAVFDEGEDEE